MTKFCYYIVINLILLSGFDARLLYYPSQDKSNFQPVLSNLKDTEKPAFARKQRERPSFLPESKKYFHTALKSSQEQFPPSDLVTNCNDEIYARFIRWKGDLTAEKCKNKDTLKSRLWTRKKKETGRKQKRKYVDYTNSQMPFNEGIRAVKTPKVDKAVASTGQMPRLRRFLDHTGIRKKIRASALLESVEEELPDNYSRVRRFLDQERAKKRVRDSATLEAKEAAMSGVLDPNLNLDGILEPHVRKRREQRLSLDLRCDYVAPRDSDQARDYDQRELLSQDLRNQFQ